jgi:hypothetical protein
MSNEEQLDGRTPRFSNQLVRRRRAERDASLTTRSKFTGYDRLLIDRLLSR